MEACIWNCGNPGLIVAILFLFVKDYKTVDLSFIDKNSNKIKMERKDMVKEFISKPSVLFTYFGMAAVVFVTTSMLTWLPTYFEKVEADSAGKSRTDGKLSNVAGSYRSSAGRSSY